MDEHHPLSEAPRHTHTHTDVTHHSGHLLHSHSLDNTIVVVGFLCQSKACTQCHADLDHNTSAHGASRTRARRRRTADGGSFTGGSEGQRHEAVARRLRRACCMVIAWSAAPLPFKQYGRASQPFRTTCICAARPCRSRRTAPSCWHTHCGALTCALTCPCSRTRT